MRGVSGSGVWEGAGFRGFEGAGVRDSGGAGVRGSEVRRVPKSGVSGGAGVWGSGCEAGAINSDGRAPQPRAGRAVFPSLLLGPSPGRGGPGQRLKPPPPPGTHREQRGPQRAPPLRELIGTRAREPPGPPSTPGPTGNQPHRREPAPGQSQDASPDSGNRDPHPGHRDRAANPSRDTGTETGPRPQAPVLTPGSGTLPEHRD